MWACTIALGRESDAGGVTATAFVIAIEIELELGSGGDSDLKGPMTRSPLPWVERLRQMRGREG